MADLHEVLLSSEWHYQNWEFHRTGFCVFDGIGFVDYVLLICFFELFYLYEVNLEPLFLFDIVFDIFLYFALLNGKLLKLFLKKVSEFFLSAMMLIN